MQLPVLTADKTWFPELDTALEDPNGLLAIGGDLSSERLLSAYQQGIFPWYSDGQPILWWSPSPRLVIDPKHLKVSRSLRKSIKNKGFSVSINQAFTATITACQTPDSNKPDRDTTWITEPMRTAYIRLFELGHAHSIEVWQNHQLVGGLYGIVIGKAFFGESMFSRVSDASKVALVYLIDFLQQQAGGFVDCQVKNPHLMSLGAYLMPRVQFIQQIHILTQDRMPTHVWQPQQLPNLY